MPQIDNVDLDILALFASHTDKACLGDLLNSKCFMGEAEELVEEFLSSSVVFGGVIFLNKLRFGNYCLPCTIIEIMAI